MPNRINWMGVPETAKITHVLLGPMNFLGTQLRDELAALHFDPTLVTGVCEAGFARDPFVVGVSRHQGVLRHRLVHGAQILTPDTCGFSAGRIVEDGDEAPAGGAFMVSPATNEHPFGVVLLAAHGAPTNLHSQPHLVLDASKGRVRHVDEIVNFVGDSAHSIMVVPDANVALKLVRAAELQSSVPRLSSFSSGAWHAMARTFRDAARTFLTNRADECDAVFEANSALLAEHVKGIPRITLPFVPGQHPNALNLLNLGTRALVPCQHSVRVTIDEARKILGVHYGTVFRPSAFEHLPTRMVFDVKDDVLLSRAQIQSAIGWEAPVAETVQGPVRLVFDRPGTVDVLEAFIDVAIRSCGFGVRFVETTALTFGGGNLHCATNRTPDLATLGAFSAELAKAPIASVCLNPEPEIEVLSDESGSDHDGSGFDSDGSGFDSDGYGSGSDRDDGGSKFWPKGSSPFEHR